MDNKTVTEARLKKFRAKLEEKNIEAALITKRENYLYLSGFTGTSAFLLITGNEAILLTDFRYEEQAKAQAPSFEIVKYQGKIHKVIEEALSQREIRNLGFEDGYMTFSEYNEYKIGLKQIELTPLDNITEKIRFIKDEYELSLITKAVEIADAGFNHILKYIKPGVSEIELALELEYHMKKLGAKSTSFDTIIASGVRSSLPHGVASDKLLEKGDTITIDFGAIYRDYCSDMTRTVFLGEPSPEMKKIYKLVLDAQLNAINAAKAGLLGSEIDAVARNLIYSNGYDKNFGHGLGHCVGLEIHEEPRLSPMGNIEMKDRMVVTVEPGIYIPGVGGVRIEDIIVINGENPVILTKSSKEMVVI